MDITIKITPNASHNAIVSYQNHILKIKIAAVAQKGKANRELVSFLSKIWHIPKRDIIIKKGYAKRVKVLHIESITSEFLNQYKSRQINLLPAR